MTNAVAPPAPDRTPRRGRLLPHLLGLLGLAALVLALLPAAGGAQEAAPMAGQSADVTPARVEGQNRFETAANIARLTYETATVAHLVTAGHFPDALAASYAAGVVDGPILPVAADRLESGSPTLQALRDLGVQRVVLVGGEAAISRDVEADLRQRGYTVERVSGVNRYQTASSIAMRYGTDGPVGTLEGQRTALLASGETFADALAAGPVAAGAHFPLFLTDGGRPDASVNQSLRQLGIERVVIVGGTAAVSSDAVTVLRESGYQVERWSGRTRTDTAATVADNAVERLGFRATLALLARGDGFADALAASAHGGARMAPLLLAANPTTLSQDTASWLSSACPDVDAVRAIGGTAAVSTDTLSAAVQAAESCEQAGATTCTNQQGFTATYPAGWATNQQAMGRIPPCSLFDPDPTSFRSETQEIPADIGVVIRVEDVAFAEASGAGPDEQVVWGPETRTVSSRTAERIEVRHTGGGFYPQGQLTTRWTVDLGNSRTLIATSHDVGQPPYPEKQAVLDQMMRGLRISSTAQRRTCTNQEGFTASYPSDWATNQQAVGTVPPCSLFDPDPSAFRSEGQHIPADIGVVIRVEDVAFAEASGAGPDEQVVTGPQSRTVDGRTAERIEVRHTGGGFYPQGQLTTRWTVDLGNGRTLIATSHDVGQPPYPEKKAVLDQMMADLRIT